MTVPAKLVKLRLRQFPAVIVRLYVPVVKLKLMLLTSVREPDETVVATAPE